MVLQSPDIDTRSHGRQMTRSIVSLITLKMDYQPQQNMVTKFMRSKLRCAMEGKRAEFYQVAHWKIGIKRGQYIEYIIICTIIEK